MSTVKWNTALYARISEQEREKKLADSISNQTDLLKDYCIKNNLVIKDTYSDDGYSGGNFDRPSFRKMIHDIEHNKINCVIVKDLSRFGRERLDVGIYIEKYFPKNDIRFISINNNIDTYANPSRTFDIDIPITNVFNEEYLYKTSAATKSVLNIKRRDGLYVSAFAPYGYLKEPDNKHHLIIDESTYKVVQSIYNMYLRDNNLTIIANYLNSQGLLSPANYRRQLKNKELTSSKWTAEVIRKILLQPIYTGDMVQGRTKSYSYKVKKRVPLRKDQWTVVPNTHDAIIDKHTFDKVQNIITRCTKPAPVKNKRPPSILSGFVVCKDCGKNMVRCYRKRQGMKTAFFICKTFNTLGKEYCSPHMIQEEILLNVVFKIISELINNIIDMESAIEANELSVKKKLILKLSNQIKALEESIEKDKTAQQGLYTNYSNKIITLEEYQDYKARYIESIQNKESKIKALHTEIKASKDGLDQRIEVEIRKFKGITQLNKQLLETLVSKIIVSDKENIQIVFNFEDVIREYL